MADLPNPTDYVNASAHGAGDTPDIAVPPAPEPGRDFDRFSVADLTARRFETLEIQRPQVPGVPSKPGYQTTEFWLTVLVIVLLFVGDIADLLPTEIAAKLAVLQAALYKVLRFVLKWRNGRQAVDAFAQVVQSEGGRPVIVGTVGNEGGVK